MKDQEEWKFDLIRLQSCVFIDLSSNGEKVLNFISKNREMIVKKDGFIYNGKERKLSNWKDQKKLLDTLMILGFPTKVYKDLIKTDWKKPYKND